jgi:hypothetical protein
MPMTESQTLTTITSWTTITGQVTITSYRPLAVATTSVTSMSTDTHNYTFTIPAQLARHCYFSYANTTLKAGDRVVAKVTVDSDTVDFFVMSKAQLLAFNHSPCDQAQDATTYVKALDIKSYVVNWVVPLDGEYDFVFFSYSPSLPKPKITGSISVQYIYNQLVASTVYSRASTTMVFASTNTLPSLYYSIISENQPLVLQTGPAAPSVPPITLLIAGIVIGIVLVTAIVVISKRRRTGATKRRRRKLDRKRGISASTAGLNCL